MLKKIGKGLIGLLVILNIQVITNDNASFELLGKVLAMEEENSGGGGSCCDCFECDCYYNGKLLDRHKKWSR